MFFVIRDLVTKFQPRVSINHTAADPYNFEITSEPYSLVSDITVAVVLQSTSTNVVNDPKGDKLSHFESHGISKYARGILRVMEKVNMLRQEAHAQAKRHTCIHTLSNTLHR